MDEYIQSLFWKKLQKPKSVVRHEWKAMSSHPFLLYEMVERHPFLDWDWRILSRKNENWKYNLILKYPWKNWDWVYLSNDVPLSFIRERPFLPWDYKIIWKRLSSPVPQSPTSFSKNWKTLSLYTPISQIFNHLQFPWDWKQVSKNKGLTIQDVCNYPFFPWDFSYVMSHTYFNIYDLKRSSITFDFKLLSQNPYCRPRYVRLLNQYPWDWTKLAIHPAFPPEKIFLDPILSRRWRWDRCLGNPYLTLPFYTEIRKQTTIPNQFSQLCQNHFEKTVSLLPYQVSVLVKFLWVCFSKKKILYRLKFILYLKQKMDTDTLRHVLFNYI